MLSQANSYFSKKAKCAFGLSLLLVSGSSFGVNLNSLTKASRLFTGKNHRHSVTAFKSLNSYNKSLQSNDASDNQKREFSRTIQNNGPILAGITYFGTKAVCYGVALAAAQAAVVGSGGTALLASNGLVIVSQSASVGTQIVANTVIATGGAGLATTTTAAVTNAVGIAKVVAAVEYAAAYLSAWAMAVPWL